MNLKKAIAIILSLSLLLVSLAACGGPSEADKAYTAAYESGHLSKVDAARIVYEAAIPATIANEDYAGALEAVETFLAVISAAVTELSAIDHSKTTGLIKSSLPEQLASLRNTKTELEEQRTIMQGHVANQQSAGGGYDDGGETAGMSEDQMRVMQVYNYFSQIDAYAFQGQSDQGHAVVYVVAADESVACIALVDEVQMQSNMLFGEYSSDYEGSSYIIDTEMGMEVEIITTVMYDDDSFEADLTNVASIHVGPVEPETALGHLLILVGLTN